jgi:hypothetical protein
MFSDDGDQLRLGLAGKFELIFLIHAEIEGESTMSE